jgi:hypothetical protein
MMHFPELSLGTSREGGFMSEDWATSSVWPRTRDSLAEEHDWGVVRTAYACRQDRRWLGESERGDWRF